MTSPDTKTEKQKRRHGPVLRGIIGAVIIAVIAILVFAPDGDDPSEPAATASDG